MEFEGEYGHLLINQKILSSSPFGRTTQTVVAFQRQHKGPSARFQSVSTTEPPQEFFDKLLRTPRALAPAPAPALASASASASAPAPAPAPIY